LPTDPSNSALSAPAGYPAGRIDGQLFPVLFLHSQKALAIVLVVAQQFGLLREIIDLGADEALAL